MLLLYSIYQEIKKMITGYIFYGAIVAVLLINMSGNIAKDFTTSETYNLIQIIGMNSAGKTELLTLNDATCTKIFLHGSQGYLWMFASLLVSAPFVMLMCSAKKNNNIRFEIYRMGKFAYVFTKGVASVLVAGVIMCVGYGLYGIVLSIFLPTGEGLSLWMIVKRLTEMFFYGMSSILLTYCLSAVMKNKYLVLCIPFMANYLLKSLLDRPGLAQMEWRTVINPSSPSYLFSMEYVQRLEVVAFWIGMFALSLFAYYMVLNRRCDCGE